MNEKINLCEVLKDCPEGTKFYSTIFGDVEFMCITDIGGYSIVLKARDEYKVCVDSEGKYLGIYNGECILFPSRDQRDWSKFKAPWYKKSKFDPKTLQPFDKVVVKLENQTFWTVEFFSFLGDKDIKCIGGYFNRCIPYNEETKHLVGTTEEAPEYYRYWDD